MPYFGEKESTDCGHCDICRCKPAASEEQNAIKAILDLVADHQKHFLVELHQLPIPMPVIDVALAKLIKEEIIRQENGFIIG